MASVKLKNFCAHFPIYSAHSRSIKQSTLALMQSGSVQVSKQGITTVKALDNLTFDLNDGDRIALLGHNGAGKSTLLRVISGVYAPTNGVIDISGKVGSLIDIGLGIDPEVTGRRNIYLRGILLGLKHRDIEGRIDEIIKFSELEEFIDLPVRTYSTGMHLRLAFASSIIMQPEILVMDEWLSVGDAAFNQKANNKLREIIDQSKILVIATHSRDTALNTCTRAIWLEHGRIKMDGPVQQVADHYWPDTAMGIKPKSEMIAAPDNPEHRSKTVAVILPVYRDANLTRACINAAMADIVRYDGARLVIVNDASPESDMDMVISEAQSVWGEKIEVICNIENQGFVKSVNLALHRCPEDDVVLLNSDVIVPKKWLLRLETEAYSDAQIATVTPLSNNTTICTFPEFRQDNTVFAANDINDIDAAFSESRLPNIEAPTGIGFCMYIKRDCLNSIGYLNEDMFPMGYGEENDLCQRAIKAGWKNVITPNLYVYHKGGVSFGDEKQLLQDNALKAIERLHPNYHQDVQSFLEDDPLKRSRIFRLIRFLGTQTIPKILHVSHGLGGGTQKHIEDLCDYLNHETNSFSMILMPTQSGGFKVRMGAGKHADEIYLSTENYSADLTRLIEAIGISLVHYHHIICFIGINLPDTLLQLPRRLGIPYRFTVHDYYLICANPTLTNKEGMYCEDEKKWLTDEFHSLPSGMSADTWQQKYRTFFENAQAIIYPSHAAYDIVSRFFKNKNTIVTPHLELNGAIDISPYPFRAKKAYKVGAIGALNKEKGAVRLEQLAHTSQLSGASKLEFTLIGYAFKPLHNVNVTGEYHEKDIQKILKKKGIDIILFTAQCPETYSYTLSIALASGLPIIAPDIGAFPERLSGRQNTFLYQYDESVGALLNDLLTFIEQLSNGKAQHFREMSPLKIYQKDFYKNDYLRGLDAQSGKHFDWHDLNAFQIKSAIIRSNKSIIRTFIWKLSYTKGFRWLRSEYLSVIRAWVKQRLAVQRQA